MALMTVCRACLGARLYMFLPLGDHPPANAFVRPEHMALPEARFALDTHVWVRDPGAGATWLTGGTYLVARRIGMTIAPITSTPRMNRPTMARPVITMADAAETACTSETSANRAPWR